MFLHGEELVLTGVEVDGKSHGAHEEVKGGGMTVTGLPSDADRAFELKVTTEIKPQDNTDLAGLYKSSGNFCTQCEAEGFRRITYFPDRPDVMSRYTTRVEADKDKYPVLLSNGNLSDSGDLPGGRHFATWVDPWPKPCYLFALVAGRLEATRDTFTTKSGNKVDLAIWVEAHNSHKTRHAMTSLQKSMKWDEDVYGLEYDLDLFNIVAVDDFNMGAMENKSLNVFNSRLILASPATATDLSYERIEGVVAHEYFHNWSGNRVTCRDWFQLSLKEGLTVFRDQSFSGDMHSKAVKRIDDVRMLRARQFPEDAGALAHPVRPASFQKIDNFYTMTVYEKGAEVIRMYHTLLGAEGYRKGTDLYFQRHDGQAVTTDDFFQAMADANPGSALHQGDFKLWYSQAGTPTVRVATSYDASAKTYRVALSQALPTTADAPDMAKKPQVIPVGVGLVGKDGQDMLPEGTRMCVLHESSQEFVFEGVSEEPALCSVLRGFSAPVKLDYAQTPEELVFQLGNDSDPFNRFEAAQRLGRAAIEAALADPSYVPSPALVEALRRTLLDTSLDKTFVAQVLSLPSADEVGQASGAPYDPVALFQARKRVVKSLAGELEADLRTVLDANRPPAGEEYAPEEPQVSRRALAGTCLHLLASLEREETAELAEAFFQGATNLTDQMAGMRAAALGDTPQRKRCLDAFYEQWSSEPLNVLEWLGVQAGSNIEGNVARVQELLTHPAFDMKNPNKVYALIGGFASSAVNFHAADGSGYAFLADAVLKIDALNAQVGARMVGPFTRWMKYDAGRQALMRAQLERICASKTLSPNVREMVEKSLKASA